MKSGLPSAVCGNLRRLRVARRASWSASCAASVAVERLERQRVCRRAGRRPSAGRASSSSGRASVRSRTGRSCRRAARSSIRSRSAGSAQWMSSKTNAVGLLARHRLDEDADRLEEAVAVGRRRLGLEAEQDREVPGDDLGLLRPDEPLDERCAASRRAPDVVAVEDAGELLHLRRERPVRAALAIREAAAADDSTPARRDAPRELGREPRLADAGRAEDRDEVRTPLALDALPCRIEERRARGCVRRTACSTGAARRRGGARTRARPRSAPPFPSPSPARPPRTRSRRAWRGMSPRRRRLADGRGCCRRDAVLTTSPATIASPCSGRAESVTIASPVFTAPRMLELELGLLRVDRRHASRTASAARTARSGSSPCAVGAPKTAITASPTNFSTTPPNDSISSPHRAVVRRRGSRARPPDRASRSAT